MTGARGIRLYTLVSAGLIAAAASAFILAWEGPKEQAVLVSAAVAFVLQVATFVVARLLAANGNGIAGWGLGAIVCFVALVVYGLLCRALGLASDAAMLSLATFFFLTEVIEPPFLNI